MTDVRGEPLRPDERRARAPREQAAPSMPIRVDWIEPALLNDAEPGRLGLTHLPGKHGISFRYPGLEYRRDLGDDLAALRAMGVGFLLLLVEDRELQLWGDPRIVQAGKEAGIEVRRNPIPDGGVPEGPEAIAELLVELRAAREHVDAAVACMGGVGRTGLVGSCALVEGGLAPGEAIEVIRRLRHPDAVETAVQQQFVETYADWTVRRSQPDTSGSGLAD
jgi:protein-tyrosine phosphatase